MILLFFSRPGTNLIGYLRGWVIFGIWWLRFKVNFVKMYFLLFCCRERALICGESGWAWCTVTKLNMCLDIRSMFHFSTLITSANFPGEWFVPTRVSHFSGKFWWPEQFVVINWMIFIVIQPLLETIGNVKLFCCYSESQVKRIKKWAHWNLHIDFLSVSPVESLRLKSSDPKIYSPENSSLSG